MVNSASADCSEEGALQTLVLGVNTQELSNARLPYLPDGELASGIQPHQLFGSRLQRVSWQGSSFVLKHLVQMALRQTAITRHLERIYDTTTSYYCFPVSEYYVFALRRILI